MRCRMGIRARGTAMSVGDVETIDLRVIGVITDRGEDGD